MSDTQALDTEATEAHPAAGESDTGGQRRPVRALVRDLLRPLRIWNCAVFLWKALASLTIAVSTLIAVIVIATLLIQGLTHQTVAIEPISVPKELADKGYTPDVAASRLRDAMNAVVARAPKPMAGPELALRGEAPDIVVPTVGISIDSIAAAIRGFLHSKRRRTISGEFTIADGRLWLRLRIDGKQSYSSRSGGAMEQPDALLAAAVPQVFKEVQPFIAASYLFSYKGDAAQALTIFDKLIDNKSRSGWNVADLYIMRASIYADQRKYAEAAAAADQAIRIAPRYAPARTVRGNISRAQHKFDVALVHYRKALKFDRKNGPAWDSIGATLNDQQKYDEAAKEFRAVIAQYPNSADYHISLGHVLRAQHNEQGAVSEFDKGVALYREDLELDPDNAATHSNLGDALSLERKLDVAADEYREVIRLEPGRRDGHIGLGNLFNQQHEPEAALIEYRKAAELDTNDADIHSKLSGVLRELGQYDASRGEAHRSIELDPAQAVGHIDLGNLLLDRGRLDDALLEYHKAAELEPASAVAHQNIGVILARQSLDGRPPAAV